MTEFEPKHPYKMLMIGSSGTGKTSTLLSELIPSDIDKVFVFAPELSLKQKSYQDAKRRMGKKLELHEYDEPLIEEIINSKDPKDKYLFVFDDVLTNVEKSKVLPQLYSSGRHANISTCTLLQQSFLKNRAMRLNTDYYVLFDFPSDKNEIYRLLRNFEGEGQKHKDLCKAYDMCVKKGRGHGWLMCDLKSGKSSENGSDMLKYRANSLDHVFDLE